MKTKKPTPGEHKSILKVKIVLELIPKKVR